MKYNGPTDFAHLHVHTLYSTLDGVQSPEELFSTCKERGWSALAVTEHGTLASVPDNYAAAKEYGVKYIVACEIYYNDYEPTRQDLVKEDVKIRKLKETDPNFYYKMSRNRHLTVLAKNDKGVENIIKLTTQAWETGFYYRPRIWFDKLDEYREGLLVLSGCLNGPVSHELRHGNLRSDDMRGALDYIHKFKEVFGDDYFVELQMPCLPDFPDHKVFRALNHIANKYNIPKVLTNDAHYLNREDFEIQKLMMAISQGLTVDDPNLFHVNSDEQYLKTRADLWHTFKTGKDGKYCEYVTDSEFEDMCNNTLVVAGKCDNFEPDLSSKVPTLDNDEQILRTLVYDRLKQEGFDKDETKYNIDNKEVTYREQADIELNRFIEKNFASYFLITRDLVQYSLDNGWPVGPRGSVGGSLVCYLLGITELDPIKWNLSFNRFLSPSRGGKMLNIKAE